MVSQTQTAFPKHESRSVSPNPQETKKIAINAMQTKFQLGFFDKIRFKSIEPAK